MRNKKMVRQGFILMGVLVALGFLLGFLVAEVLLK